MIIIIITQQKRKRREIERHTLQVSCLNLISQNGNWKWFLHHSIIQTSKDNRKGVTFTTVCSVDSWAKNNEISKTVDEQNHTILIFSVLNSKGEASSSLIHKPPINMTTSALLPKSSIINHSKYLFLHLKSAIIFIFVHWLLEVWIRPFVAFHYWKSIVPSQSPAAAGEAIIMTEAAVRINAFVVFILDYLDWKFYKFLGYEYSDTVDGRVLFCWLLIGMFEMTKKVSLALL